MPDQQLLKSLKVARLKELLVAVGSKTTGTKDQLCRRLEGDLYRPKLAQAAQHGAPSRIMSIDMGIRNLGLCVADVSFARSAADRQVLRPRRQDPIAADSRDAPGHRVAGALPPFIYSSNFKPMIFISDIAATAEVNDSSWVAGRN